MLQNNNKRYFLSFINNLIIMVEKGVNKQVKRKIVSNEECLTDLKNELPILFQSFEKAVSLYEQQIVFTPVQARARGFEASTLNSKMIESVQQCFPENWKFGKYKRFILRINGYNIFFKKLTSKDMPMNVKTSFSQAIQNQQQLKLFNEANDAIEPIVFFGYKKDKFGNIIDPKLVYIDESQVKWTLVWDDISANKEILITRQNTNTKEKLVSIRKQVKQKKAE